MSATSSCDSFLGKPSGKLMACSDADPVQPQNISTGGKRRASHMLLSAVPPRVTAGDPGLCRAVSHLANEVQNHSSAFPQQSSPGNASMGPCQHSPDFATLLSSKSKTCTHIPRAPAVQVSGEIIHGAIDPATQVSHQQDALGMARSCQLGLSELPCQSWIQPWALVFRTEYFL